MYFEIPFAIISPVLALLLKVIDEESQAIVQASTEKSSFSSVIRLPIRALGVDGLGVLYEEAKRQNNRGLMMQITSQRNLLKDPDTTKISNLKALPAGIVEFLIRNSIDGWLYKKEKDDVFLPWLVRSVEYYDANRSNQSPPYVMIQLSANVSENSDRNDHGQSRADIRIYTDHITKKTIPEILAGRGFFHETTELKANYEDDLKKFISYVNQNGEQFLANGKAIQKDGYSREIVQLGQNDKFINDESQINRVIVDKVENNFWKEKCLVGSHFDSNPMHCRLYMFNLAVHEYMWVHASYVTPYVYQPELREKLVLPDLHRDLIDILTTDMDIIMEDIVKGKSGGTTILCKGAPGLGKTLTAEVYSEVIHRPLYRIHSGQLGVTSETVEKSLATVLKRAERWNAVLLIDECDVFVRKRDNDIQHNAVVAAFLRTLEYFHGLLFMTTNRSDDIDDAIISRCIAIIKYELPDNENSKRLWKVLSSQFELVLEDGVIDALVDHFKSLSGRDIKELLKLTSKFARRKNLPLELDVFRQCAMFRGMI